MGNLISLTIHPVLVNDWQEWSGKMGLLWPPHPVHKMEIGQHCMLCGRLEEMTQTPHTSACVESGTSINSGCSRTSGFIGGASYCPLLCLLGGDQLHSEDHRIRWPSHLASLCSSCVERGRSPGLHQRPQAHKKKQKADETGSMISLPYC